MHANVPPRAHAKCVFASARARARVPVRDCVEQALARPKDAVQEVEGEGLPARRLLRNAVHGGEEPHLRGRGAVRRERGPPRAHARTTTRIRGYIRNLRDTRCICSAIVGSVFSLSVSATSLITCGATSTHAGGRGGAPRSRSVLAPHHCRAQRTHRQVHIRVKRDAQPQRHKELHKLPHDVVERDPATAPRARVREQPWEPRKPPPPSPHAHDEPDGPYAPTKPAITVMRAGKPRHATRNQ